MSDSERGLIIRAQAGEPEAFEDLIRPYQARLFRVIAAVTRSREDAEDCLQDALVQAFRAIPTFRAEASFSTWLYRVTLNATRNWLRAESRASSGRFADRLAVSARHDGPADLDAGVIRAEAADFLRRALAALPDHYREPLLLRHYQQMSYEDIAVILRIPVGTVRSRLAQARKLLLQRLDALGYPCPMREASRT